MFEAVTVPVPIATFPVKNESPTTENAELGVDVPMPTLPFGKTVKSDAPVDEAILSSVVVAFVVDPSTLKIAPGVEEPMPTLPFDRIAKTLCAAEPKNSAILPAPLWSKLKNVDVDVVEFC